jgi:hypothetical protein
MTMTNEELNQRDLDEYMRILNHPDFIYGTLPLIPEVVSILPESQIKQEEVIMPVFRQTTKEELIEIISKLNLDINVDDLYANT